MAWLLNCLTVQHDWRLTLVAAIVCLTGLATALGLIDMARLQTHGIRWRLRTAAAAVAGLSIWSTHFIGMLAYRSAAPVAYTALATVASLLVAVGGMAIVVVLAGRAQTLGERLLAGTLAISTVVSMHFLGMAAVRVEGGALSWDLWMIAGTAAAGMATALLGSAWRRDHWSRGAATAVFAALSVCILHFGSMAAVTIVPAPLAVLPAGAMSETALLAWVAVGAATLVGIAAIVTGMHAWSGASSTRRLREAIDTMSDGLAFYDASDRLQIWNARYSEVNTEISTSLAVGVRFEDLLRIGLEQGIYEDAAGREEEWLQERLAGRRRLYSTVEQHVAGDRWLRVQDRRTAGGGIVSVVNDITDLKRDARSLAEAKLAAEAANRAKSEFLANMSHEIRTPLNGVIGLTQALARTDMTIEQRDMLELIQSSGRTLQTLLSDILDLARVESGRLELTEESFDLARAVNEAAQLYATAASEKGLQFFVEVEPDAAVWVRGDVVRLKQVLTNLVSNAVKFTTQGFVSLTVSRFMDAAGAPQLRFSVEDTGIGFDAATRDRLFNRFEQADGAITRRFGGTGLGLAICRQLATMMGGELDCESEPDGGSAFILTLPLVEAQSPVADVETPAVAADEGVGERLRVLVADDHPTNRKVVELVLSAAPVDVISVENGEEALQACREAAFDLVLMDMQMPVMDGLSATRAIRALEASENRVRVPIVMLTANALPEHIAAARAAGADQHLAKPFNAVDLLALVAAAPGMVGAEAQAA